MKITQRIKNYASLALGLCLLGLGVTGCIKDEYATRELTTLTLRFTTQATNAPTPGTVLPETANEHMRTLRVILVENETGLIRFNTKIDNIPETQTEQVITFSDLITVNEGTTQFDVYAIANEETFVSSTDELAAKSGNVSQFSFDSKTLNAAILQKLNNANRSNPQSREYLPQTKVETITVEPEQANEATIKLEFVVAKIDLTFTNQSVSSINLSDISFSHMNVATTPLFPVETLSDAGSVLSLDDMSVPGGGSANKVVYVYESQIGSSENYTLSATWRMNTKSLDLTAGGLGRTFSRGTKLQINVTLNAEQEVDDLDILVSAWDEKKIEVPPFK